MSSSRFAALRVATESVDGAPAPSPHSVNTSGTGGVRSSSGEEMLVSFVFLEDPVSLCCKIVKTSRDTRTRFCMRRDCGLHKVASGVEAAELAPGLYLISGVSNNKQTCLLRPSISAQIVSSEAIKTLVALNEEVPIDDAINVMSIVNEGDDEGKKWSSEEILELHRKYREGVYDRGLESQGLTPRSAAASERGGFGFPAPSPAKSAGFSSPAGSADEISRLSDDDDLLEGEFDFLTASDEVEEHFDPEKFRLLVKHMREFRRAWQTAKPTILGVGATTAAVQKEVKALGTKVTSQDDVCLKLRRDVDELERDTKALKADMEEVIHAMTDPGELPATVKIVNRLNTFVNDGSSTDGRGLERWLEARVGSTGAAGGYGGGGSRFSTLRVGAGGYNSQSADPFAARSRNGGGGSVAERMEEMEERHQRELRTLTARLSSLETGPSGGGRPNSGGLGSPPNNNLHPEMLAQLTALTARVADVESRGNDVPVVVGRQRFASLSDVAAFVNLYFETEDDVYFAVQSDIMIGLQRLKMSGQDATVDAVNAKKVNLDAREVSALGSYSLTLPRIFDSSGSTALGSTKHPLPLCKTWKEWSDPQIGLRVRSQAEGTNEYRMAMSRLLGMNLPSEAHLLFTTMLSESANHWTSLCGFIDSSYHLYHGVYGMTDSAAWNLTGTAVLTIFRELRKMRVMGQDLMSESGDLTRRDRLTRAVWASLRAMRLMNEYLEASNFVGHPSLAHVNAEHLLRDRISRHEFDQLRATANGAQTGLANALKDVDRLLAHANMQPTKRGRPQNP